mgnify:CR=1 FL=1
MPIMEVSRRTVKPFIMLIISVIFNIDVLCQYVYYALIDTIDVFFIEDINRDTVASRCEILFYKT